MNNFLTMDEAAKYLGISKLTLYGWISTRKLRYVKIGRLVKFKQDQLEPSAVDGLPTWITS